MATGDVIDDASVRHVLTESRPGTVFHLAGLVKARRTSDFLRVNRGGVEAVAAACAALDRPPVLVLVSSLAAAGPSLGDRARTESDAPAPISAYGRSKLAGELAAAAHAGTGPVTIVRPPVVYGPSDRALLAVFRAIARWGVHLVPGRASAPDHCLSLIHVDDLVDGLIIAERNGSRLESGGTLGAGTYFLAASERPSYADLGLAIARALDRKPPAIVRVPGPVLRLLGLGGDVAALLGREPGWINSDKVREALSGPWTCGTDKAHAELALPQTRTLDEGLRETAGWYRQAGWL